MTEVIHEVFLHNILALLIISIAWIPLYFGKKILEWLAGETFVKIPISISVTRWRKKKRIGSMILSIQENKISTGNDNTLEMTRLISGKIVELNKKFHDLSHNRMIRLILDKWMIDESIKNTYQKSIWKLEIDMAFAETISKEADSRLNAYQTLIEHRGLSDELALNYLIPKLRYLDTELFVGVLYTLGHRINSETQIASVKEIAENKLKETSKTTLMNHALLKFTNVAIANVSGKTNFL